MQSYQNVSNSQRVVVRSYIFDVANAYAKLSKCQQFTTLTQSYLTVCSCKRLCKVIKMLAIHNGFKFCININIVANAYAKLSKCQQFTTNFLAISSIAMLQTLMQSYQNVSNSQQATLQLIVRVVANAYAKLSKCQQFTTWNLHYKR